MKLSMLVPAIFMGSPASFVVSGVAHLVGLPGAAALTIGFGGCTLAAWSLITRISTPASQRP